MANFTETTVGIAWRETSVAEAPPPRADQTAIVCRCLGVTAAELQDAVEVHDACTVQELRDRTGAGDGCTSCHRFLKMALATRR